MSTGIEKISLSSVENRLGIQWADIEKYGIFTVCMGENGESIKS